MSLPSDMDRGNGARYSWSPSHSVTIFRIQWQCLASRTVCILIVSLDITVQEKAMSSTFKFHGHQQATALASGTRLQGEQP